MTNRKLRRPGMFFLSLLIGLMLLGFNNCSSNLIFESYTPDVVMSASLGGGNGEGFEGKISGHFLRLIPGHGCGDVPSPYGHLRIDSNQSSQLDINRPDKCLSDSGSIDFSAIDWSPYNPQVVGFLEGIYDRDSKVNKSKKTSNIVEAWCQVKDSPKIGLDVVVRYNLETDLAEAAIYIGETQGQLWRARKVEPFKVERLISDQQASYRATSFNLTVDRTGYSLAHYGKFSSKLEMVLDHKPVVKQLQCRLGGAMDPAIISYSLLESERIKITPDGKKVLFLAPNQPGGVGKSLFAMNVDGSGLKKMNPSRLTSIVKDYEINPNSSSVAFIQDYDSQGIFNLYYGNFSTSHIRKLNSPGLDHHQQSVQQDFRFSADGRTIFYRDGAQSIGDLDSEVWGRTVNLESFQIELMHPELLGADMTTMPLFYQAGADSLLYATGFALTNNSLNIYSNVTKQSHVLLTLEGYSQFVFNYGGFANTVDYGLDFGFHLDGTSKVVFLTHSFESGGGYKLQSIDLSGNNLTNLGSYFPQSWGPIDTMIVRHAQNGSFHFMTSDGEKNVGIPSSNAKISQNGRMAIYLETTRDNTRPMSWSYKSIDEGEEVTVRPEHDHLGIQDFHYSQQNNKVYYWTINPDGQHMSLYQNLHTGGAESRVFHSKISLGTIRHFSVSSDNDRALFEVRRQNGNEVRLIYLDGHGHGHLMLMSNYQDQWQTVQADKILKNIILTNSQGNSSWFRLK